MGNIVAITCPHCGGQVQRANNEYFAKCPYCGIEVAFNEIKEEAQLGAYKDRLNVLEQNESIDTAKRLEMQKWVMIRNIVLVVISLLTFLAFVLVGMSTMMGIETFVGLGSICLLLALGGTLAAVPSLSVNYPGYNALYRTNEKFGKLTMMFKLGGLTVGLMLVSAFVAYFVLRIIGG